MTGNVIKVRLRSASREIEIEGLRPDIDELLAKWWTDNSGDEEGQPDDDAPVAGSKTRERGQRAKSPRKTSKPKSNSVSVPDTIDVNSIANSAKERPDFPTIMTKVIRPPGDWYHKVACVLWLANVPLTSGQIKKVVETLGVRADLPGISKILKKNITKFITPAGRGRGGIAPVYSLTVPAKAELETWLGGA